MALAVIVVPAVAQDDEAGEFNPAEEVAELGLDVTGDIIECPEGTAEITFAGGSVGNELIMAQYAADIFEDACPDVSIEVVQMPDSATDRLNIYLQEWEAESDNIDVFQVDVIWPAIIEPHVVDMREYLSEDFINMLFEDMVAGQTVGEKLVAIPWFADAAGLYVRTDLLEEYGVEIPETWDDLAAAATTIQEGVRADTGNEDFWGFVWQGNDYEGLTCDAHEWLVAETGETFISAEGEVNVLNDQFIDALERAGEWVGTISPPGVTTYQEEESRAVFQSGNAAFMRNWPYAFNLAQSEDSPVAGNIDWVPLPTGDERSAACLGGWQLAVSQYSDNVAAATEFAKYLASPEQQLVRALIQGQLPSMPEVYENELAQEDPLLNRAGPILGTAYARPSVATGASYNEASAIFSSGVHSVLTGDLDAETAAEELQINLEDFLAGMEDGS
jgi:trehalose/maltose transport system substrate-binding protein